jgi:hypothetical protein
VSQYSVDMAERAIQKFSDDFFQERALPKGGPIMHLLASSRAEAARALLAMIDVDPEQPEVIRKLQNRVRMHLDLLRWTGETINNGEQIYAQMEIEQQEDMHLAALKRGGDATMMGD